MNAKKTARRARALERLDAQLQRGTRPVNRRDPPPAGTEPYRLTPEERTRINNERATLRARI